MRNAVQSSELKEKKKQNICFESFTYWVNDDQKSAKQ